MAMIEFVGQSARDSDDIAANPSRLINLYREPVISGGRAAAVLKPVLGLSTFSAIPSVWVRAMASIGGLFYAVSGGALYKIDSSGGQMALGAVDNAANTTIAGNNGDVTIVANGKYFRWNGTAINQPTAGAFSSFGSHDYITNYTVLTEKNGRKFQWSDIANANSLPGLNFSTADGRDDNLIRPMAINGVLYLFKETSHEVWYVTGQAGAAAFERQTGGVVDVGLKAHDLICKTPGAAFFIGSDNKAYLISGGNQPVSTPPVETAISLGQPKSCFFYEDEGHSFCVVTFYDRPAWVYDISTGEWHERADGADLAQWTASCSVKYSGAWYVGRDDGQILKMERVGTDSGGVLVKEATSRTFYSDGKRVKLNEFELFPRQGFYSGTIELEVSKDGGLTFTDPKARTIGPVGNYMGRVIWRGLGQARQFTARVRWSGADDVTLLAEGRVK